MVAAQPRQGESAVTEDLAIETRTADIQDLPFDSSSFDLVLANHVLYHLSGMDRGVREFARVTRPTGALVATTNADDISVAVIALHLDALRRIGFPAEPEGPSSFSLRNGQAILQKSFADVRLHTFRDRLIFRNSGELVNAYRMTGRFRAASKRPEIDESALVRAAEEAAAEWAVHAGGELISPVVMGAFICSGPRTAAFSAGRSVRPSFPSPRGWGR